MCGIIGQMAFGELDDNKEKIRQESMIFIGSELLQLSQEKGKDATGTALLFNDGNYVGLKMGIPSIEFISRFGKTNKEYGGFVKVWRENEIPARVFLGHCRNTTRGNALDNVNNHPIKVGDVIGVHNGTITNDDKIFRNLKSKRDGQVDSEAIFRLLHHFSKNGTEPITIEMLEEIVQRITGTFSVLAFSGNNPYQVYGFRDGRPLEMVLIKPLKLVVCATEKKFIETTLFRYNKHINLYMRNLDFQTLRKGDLEYVTLQDDSAVVFDLRIDIKKDTCLKDLYDWNKMPRTKIEGYDSTYTTYGANNTNKFSKNKTQTVKTVINREKKDDAKVKDDVELVNEKTNGPAGRIWNKTTQGYEPDAASEIEVEELTKVKNVELDIDSGRAKNIGIYDVEETNDKTGNRVKAGFELQNKGDDMENSMLPGSSAEIEEIETADTTDNKNSTDSEANTVEVDVRVDTEAIEKAEELVKTLPQYETDDEILEALEIADRDTLKSLPVFALTNRIVKFIFKQGIVKGYSARKLEGEKTGGEFFNKKILAAEKHIRISKAAMKMLLNIIKFSNRSLRDNVVDRVVTEALSEKEEVSRESLDGIFKAGDDRNHEVIRKIKYMVKQKENR